MDDSTRRASTPDPDDGSDPAPAGESVDARAEPPSPDVTATRPPDVTPPPPAAPSDGPLWATPPTPKRGVSWRRVVLVAVVVALGYLALREITRPTADEADIRAAEEIFRGLPAAARGDLEAEFEELADLAGDRFTGKSGTEIAQEVGILTRSGFARLDDATLIRRLELQTLALDRALTADCAAFIRAGLASPTRIEIGVDSKVIAKLNEAELVEWYGLAIRALRAELERRPDVRTVSETAFLDAMAVVSETWSDDEVTLIEAVSDNPTGSADGDVCTVGELIYGRLDVLSEDELALFALYDINPAP